MWPLTISSPSTPTHTQLTCGLPSGFNVTKCTSASDSSSARASAVRMVIRAPGVGFEEAILTAAAERSGDQLDSPAPSPGRDGGGHDSGLGHRRAAGGDGPGHDRGLRYRRADDADSSYSCSSEGHFTLLRSLGLHRPRSTR